MPRRKAVNRAEMSLEVTSSEVTKIAAGSRAVSNRAAPSSVALTAARILPDTLGPLLPRAPEKNRFFSRANLWLSIVAKCLRRRSRPSNPNRMRRNLSLRTPFLVPRLA